MCLVLSLWVPPLKSFYSIREIVPSIASNRIRCRYQDLEVDCWVPLQHPWTILGIEIFNASSLMFLSINIRTT